MIQIKPGVDFSELSAACVVAAWKVHGILAGHGFDFVMTSGRDGAHKQGSLHYEYPGRAFDCRSRHLPREKLDVVLDAIRRELGPDFDVLLEKRNAPGEHFHVEHDPKGD